jgi:hypothetical protein
MELALEGVNYGQGWNGQSASIEIPRKGPSSTRRPELISVKVIVVLDEYEPMNNSLLTSCSPQTELSTVSSGEGSNFKGDCG